jgi:hypothetical protein
VGDLREVRREAVTGEKGAAKLVPARRLDDGEGEPGEDDRRAGGADQQAAAVLQGATSGRER